MRGVKRRLDPGPARQRIGLLMPGEIADQRIFDREHRIALQIGVGAVEDVGGDLLVTLGRYDEMNMRRPPGVTAGRLQHPAHGPVRRDRVVDRQYRADQIAALGVAVELAAHVQPVQLLVLGIVEPVGLRLPDVEHRAGDRLAVEIEHSAADQRRGAGVVAMGDVAAGRHLRGAKPVERAEHRRFGRPVGFPMIEQVDHHRDAQRIGEQDEFLPLVAAHLTGFGQDLDRLEPFGLGQLHLLDEGM